MVRPLPCYAPIQAFSVVGSRAANQRLRGVVLAAGATSVRSRRGKIQRIPGRLLQCPRIGPDAAIGRTVLARAEPRS